MIPLRVIHQIEVTSRCNLKCRYCVHPKMPRAKGDMDLKTFQRALHWVQAWKQTEVNLAGIGESTMHPDFVEFVALAREAVGPEGKVVFATNGVLVTEVLVKALLPYRPEVFVSLHQPVLAGPAVQVLRRHGLLAGLSVDPALNPTDWAGQVKWAVGTEFLNRTCPWVAYGWVMVLSDGRVTRCSFDATGQGVLGHVDDDLSMVQTSPWSLCRTCDQVHPPDIAMLWDQPSQAVA